MELIFVPPDVVSQVAANTDCPYCAAFPALPCALHINMRRITVPRYRKKPVEIEAIRYVAPDDSGRGGNLDELVAWVGERTKIEPTENWGVRAVPGTVMNRELYIGTLEDGSDAQVRHVASPGDYIICGVKGEFYPCKADIFDESYELVTDPDERDQ